MIHLDLESKQGLFPDVESIGRLFQTENIIHLIVTDVAVFVSIKVYEDVSQSLVFSLFGSYCSN